MLLVRHAKAGKRSEWGGDDRLRPLDEKGRRQAAGLTELLAQFPVDRIVSSSYARCVQTVEPLAERLGLPVEYRAELEEGAPRATTLALMSEVGANGVLCTHGDVLEGLFGEDGKKGSTRLVELRDGEPVEREYLPPPS